MARLVYPDGILELLLSQESTMPADVQIQQTGDHEYLILKNTKVYNVHLRALGNNRWLVRINAKEVTVELKDDSSLLLERLGMTSSGKQQAKELKAPMPGLILDIPFSEGTQVETGQVLMVLEAMKMENLLKSGITGTISKIWVKKGDKVEKNQPLISFD